MIGKVLCLAAAGLLLYAALHDIAARTVPNWLPAALLAVGLALRLRDHTLGIALAVALGTFLLLLGPWLAGAMGGGDVKLWAATVLLIPPLLPQELDFFLRVLIAGGVLALLYLALRRVVRLPRPARRPRLGGLPARMLRVELWRIARRAPLPYACAIAGGALLTLLPLFVTS